MPTGIYSDDPLLIIPGAPASLQEIVAAAVSAERARCSNILADLRRAKEAQVKHPTPGYATAGYLEALREAEQRIAAR